MPITLISVHGTHGLSHQTFWRPESLFQGAARSNGFIVLDDPFRWSGDLAVEDYTPWQVAASALCWYCRANHLEAPAVLSHSHGAQVVAYAASWGQRFSAWLDIEGPVRNDLADIYASALRHIGHWTHTWNGGDGIMMAGEFGESGPVTALMPGAENYEINMHYRHSALFDDIPAWGTLGLWNRLKFKG